jgi:hypothetical protein
MNTSVRLVPRFTYDLHRTSGLGGCQFLLFSGPGFCNRGPLAGVKETISESILWLHARR